MESCKRVFKSKKLIFFKIIKNANFLKFSKFLNLSMGTPCLCMYTCYPCSGELHSSNGWIVQSDGPCFSKSYQFRSRMSNNQLNWTCLRNFWLWIKDIIGWYVPEGTGKPEWASGTGKPEWASEECLLWSYEISIEIDILTEIEHRSCKIRVIKKVVNHHLNLHLTLTTSSSSYRYRYRYR